MSAALVPWNPRRVPTLWLDVDTGAGVDDAGAPLAAGSKLTLADVLTVAERVRAERVQLTGGRISSAWLLAAAPGWTHGSHHLDAETPAARYHRTLSAGESERQIMRVEIRRAVEWFGQGNYSPADARAAWGDLEHALGRHVPGCRLLASPGATGQEAWLRSLPRVAVDAPREAPPQVSDEVAELLRATSGQHRIELMPPPAAGKMAALWLLDGRLMYAACLRELGTAPVTMLTGGQAAELLASPAGRFARARYQVRASVPAGWDRVGILPLAGDDGETWTYPRQPRRTFTTWADSAEISLALEHGWNLEPLAGMSFTAGRPLDTWAARILRAFNEVDPNRLGTVRARMVKAGLRWMLLHSVGAWHSSGRTETTITPGPMTRPAGEGWRAPEVVAAGTIWRRRVELDGRAAAMAHPEWSAQIWGRARARILQAPTAVRGVKAGALWVPPSSVVSIYGDAVMTTERPAWATDEHDDGAPGRLRVKGLLPGPRTWPTTARQRDQLMHAAERHAAKKG